jgi:PIN domain nuclease of toxin-antitoxin system
MKILFDTHSFLWFIQGNTQELSPTAQQILQDQTLEPILSIASVWEMGIKVKTGKLPLFLPFSDFVQQCISDTQLELVPIETADTVRVSSFPLHHRDPFDRMIIAQSMRLNVPILSRDTAFDDYGVQRIW